MNKYKFKPWLSHWELIPDGAPFVDLHHGNRLSNAE